MTKILLTGTTGFLGYQFLKSIIDEKKYNITDIIRSDKKKLKNLRNKNKNYKSIKFKNYDDLQKKLKNKKFDFFINFASNYKNQHKVNDIQKMVESNIVFPNFILENIGINLKKFITFGSMMEYDNSKNYRPLNYYSSTKKAFEDILEFYKIKFKNCKFHIIKLYDTFGNGDDRKKIIPTILNSLYSSKKVFIVNKNLKLNIILSDSINIFIKKLFYNKYPYTNIILKNKKNIKILSLLKKISLNSKIKIKYKILNKKNYFNYQKSVNNCKIVFFKDDIEKFILNKLND